MKLRYWGSLGIEELRQATQLKGALKEYKGKKELSVEAVKWEDNNISISIYDKESNSRIDLGHLKVSRYQDGGGSTDKPAETTDNLPF